MEPHPFTPLPPLPVTNKLLLSMTCTIDTRVGFDNKALQKLVKDHIFLFAHVGTHTLHALHLQGHLGLLYKIDEILYMS
jgi:hypothetical protein